MATLEAPAGCPSKQKPLSQSGLVTTSSYTLLMSARGSLLFSRGNQGSRILSIVECATSVARGPALNIQVPTSVLSRGFMVDTECGELYKTGYSQLKLVAISTSIEVREKCKASMISLSTFTSVLQKSQVWRQLLRKHPSICRFRFSTTNPAIAGKLYQDGRSQTRARKGLCECGQFIHGFDCSSSQASGSLGDHRQSA